MIYTVMGALKVGGYRSAQLYLDAAKQCRISLGLAWDSQLQQAYRAAVRSCQRGIGHAKQASGLPLDKVADLPRWEQLVPGGPSQPVTATLLASWWLLREIEASRARRKHISLNEDEQKVTWRLPSSKTDQAALGALRSHTCSCTIHTSGLCPYHVMREHLSLIPDHPDQWVFPTASNAAASKRGWADTFEVLAARLGLPTQHSNGARAYTGHSARVTGARFMASHNIELWRIQLFGRWGSDVLIHYIQDAPLAQLDQLALESTAAMSVQRAQEQLKLLREKIAQCRAPFMSPEPDMLEDCAATAPLAQPTDNVQGAIVQNTARGGKFHCTLIYKLDIHPRQWRTRCGWPFGRNQSEYAIQPNLDDISDTQKCVKCFPKPTHLSTAHPSDTATSTESDQRDSDAGGN